MSHTHRELVTVAIMDLRVIQLVRKNMKGMEKYDSYEWKNIFFFFATLYYDQWDKNANA